MGWWGIGDGAGSDTTSSKSTRDGVVSGSVNTDEYRQYLEYHHMLYSEGLMTRKASLRTLKCSPPRLRATRLARTLLGLPLEYLSSEQEKDWVVLPPIQALEGVDPIANGEVQRSTIPEEQVGCHHPVRVPEAAIRLWDYYQSRDTESALTVALGAKGELWDEYEDGSGYYFVFPRTPPPSSLSSTRSTPTAP